MINFVKERNSLLGEEGMLSFANVALSNRLTEDPMRFFKSGYQTTEDIVKLFTGIRNGTHPVIPKTGRFNIFAYSIGAFLAEIILMGNPDDLFSESKRGIRFQQHAGFFEINYGYSCVQQGIQLLPERF